MATAFRFDTVRSLPLAALDRVSGRVEVITKGGKEMKGRLDPNAMAHLRAYLRLRPETNSPQLFVTEEGNGLSYWGGRMIWRRIQRRSGVKRLGATWCATRLPRRWPARARPSPTSRMCWVTPQTRWHATTRARHARPPRPELMAKHSLAS